MLLFPRQLSLWEAEEPPPCSPGDPGVSQYILWSRLTAQPMAITSATMIEQMKYVLFVRGIGQGGG